MSKYLPNRRCSVRVGIAFAAGIAVSVSMASFASFQYLGVPPGSAPSSTVGSSVYLTNPADMKTPPALQGMLQVGTVPGLVQRGAGIAWPCHGSDQGPLDVMLYRLLPSGWKLYVKPGTDVSLESGYACHGNPWTTPINRMLRSQGLTGTLWWGYDVLSIAPQQVAQPTPLPPQNIQPGGPMIPAAGPKSQKTYPLALTKVVKVPPKTVHTDPPAKDMTACAGHGIHAGTPSSAEVMTIGKDGKVISAGWDQHVIPWQTAVAEHWRLDVGRHPTPAQRKLAEAWMGAGGVLFRHLPPKG